jgi:F-type H+-transporting ATPase subunit b
MLSFQTFFSGNLTQLPVYLLTAHAGHQPSFWEHILESNLINVLLVALLLGWIIKKNNLLSGIDAQRAKIAEEVAQVERHKQEALAQLEEMQRRTNNLKNEIEDILKNARESAEALSAQIIADARLESAKIVDNAKKRVELEQRAAAKELEKRLLNDALADAREELAKTLTSKDQSRSVEAFIEELAQLKGGKA